MNTSSKSKEYYIRQINDLTYDKDLLTGQLQASKNTSKNLDNECKDLIMEVNQLRIIIEELKTSLSQQHELRYYISENTELQSRKEVQAYKQYLVAINAYNNFNGGKLKV